MQLEIGKQYKTRNGLIVGIFREMEPEMGKNFTKVSEIKRKFIGAVGHKKRFEIYNQDGSYVKPNGTHPLDIVSEL